MGLSSGTILFKGPPRLRPVTLFKAAIITLPDILPPIINGSEFELFILGREVGWRHILIAIKPALKYFVLYR